MEETEDAIVSATCRRGLRPSITFKHSTWYNLRLINYQRVQQNKQIRKSAIITKKETRNSHDTLGRKPPFLFPFKVTITGSSHFISSRIPSSLLLHP